MTAEAEVWACRTDVSMDELSLRLIDLEDGGLLGLSEEDGRATAWFPSPVDGLDGEWSRVKAGGWDEAWRAELAPVTAGPFVIAPPWKATGDPREIIIEPAQAFGTGHHETTVGCIVALSEVDLAGRSVLDVGTGTGILGIAAVRLGAGEVIGCDTDDIAVATARANAVANDVVATDTARGMRVVAGSIDAVGPGSFDVVVANLTTNVIAEMAATLVQRCRRTLIVSGVSCERTAEAVAALQQAGIQASVREGREWVVLRGDL